MFDHLSQWQWVWLAWGELILAYIGYLVYLGWRARRIKRAADDT